jgi:murein DD-endopeptidase MepM/ murein hydrolase activator NlpD
VLYGGFAALVATNALTLVALLMAPDLAGLVKGPGEQVLTAYEARISQLRLEVDRLQSRHYAQTGDINLQLQELTQQQEVLIEQHQYVKQLADKAASLGITAAVGAPPAPVLTPANTVATVGDASAQVAAATANLDRMMDDSRLALSALSEEADTRTDRIMGALASVGIQPKLKGLEEMGEGGPLLPPIDGPENFSLIDDANNVAEALERLQSARSAAELAPVHRPMTRVDRVSSVFGNRKDPFTGRLAFHSGIDFAAPNGTDVLAAGAGKVSFVGQISGYGNVVEVTHGNGLITRYGHLSAFLVSEGQTVSTGTAIAKVGSTGRSTGPHLHFEVRRADAPVDPTRYLNAGRMLQAIVAG